MAALVNFVRITANKHKRQMHYISYAPVPICEPLPTMKNYTRYILYILILVSYTANSQDSISSKKWFFYRR